MLFSAACVAMLRYSPVGVEHNCSMPSKKRDAVW